MARSCGGEDGLDGTRKFHIGLGQREDTAALEERAKGMLYLACIHHFHHFECFKHNKILESVEGLGE